MIRYLGLALAGVALSACSDRASLPTSPVHPTGPSYDLFGDPPPPPIGSSDGFADFSTESFDLSSASVRKQVSVVDTPPCEAATSFHFAYMYFVNKPDNNAFLHINPDDPSKNVEIHQTDKKIDAHGVIVGPGFTYTITGAIGGAIVNPDEHVPGAVNVQLTGVLHTDVGASCQTTANLAASLSGEFHGE
jgi:hypothetical protein